MWPPFFFGVIPTYGVLPYAMIHRPIAYIYIYIYIYRYRYRQFSDFTTSVGLAALAPINTVTSGQHYSGAQSGARRSGHEIETRGRPIDVDSMPIKLEEVFDLPDQPYHPWIVHFPYR